MHIGHPNFNKKVLKSAIRKVLPKKNHYVILMGDHIEASTKYSIGWDTQNMLVNKQIKEFIKYFKPLAETGRIIGILDGNHEKRITRITQINITELIANVLDIEYFGYSKIFNFEGYEVYATHGAGAATTVTGRDRVFQKMIKIFDADIYLVGHYHSLFRTIKTTYYNSNELNNRERYCIMTGSSFNYLYSYAHNKLLEPDRIGFVKIALNIDNFNIEVTDL